MFIVTLVVLTSYYLIRFPLPLATGTQCKVLSGFGKTICARLDQRLAQYQAKHGHHEEQGTSHKINEDTSLKARQTTNKTKVTSNIARKVTTSSHQAVPSSCHIQIPLSPVLLPNGQLPHNTEIAYISPEKSKPSISLSPCNSESYSPPRSSVFDLSPKIDLRTQEEKDLELALALSQADSGGDDDHAQLSQLESDHQLAVRLQAELSGDKHDDNKEPSTATTNVDEDYDLAVRLSQGEIELSDGDEDGLPDISLIRRVRPEPVVEDDTNDNELAAKLTINGNTNHKARVATHDMSIADSDAEEDIATDRSEVLDKLFANDPVFNLGKNKKKGTARKSKADKDTSKGEEIKEKKKKEASSLPATPKAYVPKAGSGAYAVLITLAQHSNSDSYRGYMTKAELCQEAQPLSEHSFTLNSVRAEHYNAWSGVGTLLKHSLVTKWSNPAKFNITDKGLELAKKILAIENGEDVGTSFMGKRNIEQDSTNDDGGNKKKRKGDVNIEQEKDPRKVSKVPNKQKKTVRSPKKSKECLVESDPDDYLQQALELSRREAVSASSQAMAVGGEPIKGLGVSGVNFDLGVSFGMENTLTEEDFGVPGSSTKSATVFSPESIPPTTSTTSSNLPLALNLANMYKNCMSASGPQADSHTPEFVLGRGCFDILLCVDNTEVKGGGVGGRQNLKVETVRHLQQCGVMYDRRNLNIGDFLWIARERVGEVQGQFRQRQPRELVLPFIVERKRLDDLWMSVKDGRYEEQKFRMKGCGLPHLYYLIEDHPGQKQFWGKAAGQGGALVTPEAIEQAIANTAVQEGFTIKKTADQKGTIEYLTLFTRLLRDKYLNQDLSSCTNSDLAEGLVGHRDTTLLTFQEFNESSKKNKQLSVTEVFAKMLLRLKGLSVEMAQTIVKKYPTPHILMEAYSRCDNGVERIKMISELAYGMEGKRKIPKTIAEALMKFWTCPNLM